MTDLDEIAIEVCFRRIFQKHPQYKIGDIVKTTFDEAVAIIENTKETAEPKMEGMVYIVETLTGKRKKVHESAILGSAQKPTKQTTFSKRVK